MTRQELDQRLNQGTLPNAIMLYGDSHFLIDRYTKAISAISDANLLSLYHNEYAFDQAKAHLSQASLFGDRNVLVIKHENKVPKSDLDTLLALCQKNPDNLFIYAYYGTDFKRPTVAAFTPKSGGVAVRIYAPFFSEARTMLLQEAKQVGVNMDQNAAYHLLMTQNNDLGLACNELGKLSILNRPITTKDIDDLVHGASRDQG
jgi:DNA polymerase-3 subunit delta